VALPLQPSRGGSGREDRTGRNRRCNPVTKREAISPTMPKQGGADHGEKNSGTARPIAHGGDRRPARGRRRSWSRGDGAPVARGAGASEPNQRRRSSGGVHRPGDGAPGSGRARLSAEGGGAVRKRRRRRVRGALRVSRRRDPR